MKVGHAALVAALVAAAIGAIGAIGASRSEAARNDIRIEDLKATPQPPRAGAPFELAGRVQLGGGIGSIHCRVWVAGRRYRNVRLVWDGATARCAFVVPAFGRGRIMAVRIVARQGGNRAQTTLRFRVS
jgi:hypothetical protein